MEPIVCLHCEQPTFTYLDKLKATHWATITCPQCGGRHAAQPWAMLALWFLHMWNVFFFGFMAFYDDPLFYGAALIIGWLLLDFFGYYIPLVRLRSKISAAP